jgi:hypothetical protein
VLGDHDLVTGAQSGEGLVELGAAGEFSTRLVGVDAFAVGRGQGVCASGCWSRVETRATPIRMAET